ncbi:hypothetical protein I4U23_006746 [Adineta vaga]|nr:hypothetical protein I4U23_006746 [Adineta vaga]
MFCCLPFSKTSSIINTHNDERKPILTSGTRIIYHTPLSIPYSDVIHHDHIQVASSNVVEENASDTLLFNGTMPDRTCQTRKLSSLLVDDNNNNTSPIVLTITDKNGYGLSERLLSIDHVSATNFSKNSPMSSSKSAKTNLSNPVAMARPFDVFLTTVPVISATGSFDDKSLATTTTAIKSDKD